MSRRVGEEANLGLLRSKGVVRARPVEGLDAMRTAGVVAAADAAELGDMQAVARVQSVLGGQRAAQESAGMLDAATQQIDQAGYLEDVMGASRILSDEGTEAGRALVAGGREVDKLDAAAARLRDRVDVAGGQLDAAADTTAGTLRSLETAQAGLARAETRLAALRAVGGDAEALAAEVKEAQKATKGLTRMVERSIPKKIERAMGGEARAADKVAERFAQYEPAREAARMAREGFESTRVDLERRIAIGEEAAAALPVAKGRRREALQTAARLRRQAVTVTRDAEKLTGKAERYIAGLEVQRLEAEALAAELNVGVAKLDASLSKLWTPDGQDAIRSMIQSGLAQEFQLFGLSKGYKTTATLASGQLGEEIPAEVLTRLLKAKELSDAPGKILKTVDAANRGFKTYALLTPGFHVRNFIGGVFNNMVADVDLRAYSRFAAAWDQSRRVAAGKATWAEFSDQGAARVMQEILDSGLLDDLNRIADAAENPTPTRFEDVFNVNGKRFLTDNPLTRFNRYAGDKVEDMLRGTLAFDRLSKGLSMDAALDDVYHSHFDYADLSKVERGVVRRAVPFWTWTSRNLGNQLDFFLSNPKAYQRWNNVRDFLEPEGQEEEGAVPGYLEGPGSIPLGGGHYLQPGMPFEAAAESLRKMGDPAAFALQDAAPWIKTPIEGRFDTQFFSDLPLSQEQTEPPKTWTQIPGLMKGLELAGWARKDRYGNYSMSGEQAYYVEQALPTLGRFRRLAPSEERYQERAVTSWLSFMGIGSRTNDSRTQNSEMFRRADELQKIKDRAEEAGYVFDTDR